MNLSMRACKVMAIDAARQQEEIAKLAIKQLGIS